MLLNMTTIQLLAKAYDITARSEVAPSNPSSTFVHWLLVSIPWACYYPESKKFFKKRIGNREERKITGCSLGSAYDRKMAFHPSKPIYPI